ncbi:MAG: response regulator [Acidobacteria bacterium]|nr:response regulator [Acidobacteriota bacterium]
MKRSDGSSKLQKILIADDHPMNREMLAEMLISLGYEAIVTSNGEEALQKIEQAKPDLALIDIQMPKLDGMAFIQRIREKPHFATFPVIALTAYAMQGDRERMLEAGFTSYIAKPFHLDVLEAELQRLLQ